MSNVEVTNRAPMKIRKSTFKWLVWSLAFFLATAGLAQGAERCKGKCCQESREPAGRDPGALELSLNPRTPLDAFLPSCHMSDPLDVQRAAVTERETCQDESTPSCCHMGKARVSVQALAVQGHFGGTDRFPHADMVLSIQPQDFLNEEGARLALAGWALHPRAAPVPLYLKNTSFIC